MKRIFQTSRVREMMSRLRLTTIIGAILTVVSVALATSLSLSAFASAQNIATVQTSLAEPTEIDQTAQAKYFAKLAADKAAQAAKAEAERAKISQEKTAPTQQNSRNTQTPTTSPDSTPAQPATYAYDRLIISKMGLSTRLATVGLTADGAVDVNASLAAWFNQSARPGTSSGTYSATFIDGHNPGIFSRLGALAAGDQVTVSLANGAGDYTYTVCATEIVNLESVNMSKALSRQCGGSQGLNLMTCWGAYTGNTRAQRLVVYTGR